MRYKKMTHVLIASSTPFIKEGVAKFIATLG